MSEFNVALLVIVIIVCILVFLVNIYVLINYQHPDDYNQAWFPKIVVVLGLSVAQISILMLPADVANKHACSNSIYNGACKLTLPMKKLWLAIWIIDSVLVFFVIPFAIFYYEGDQEKTVPQRVVSAMLWESLTAVIVGLVLGILYGLVGKVDFTVRRLSSTTVPFTTDFSFLSQQFPCLSPTNMAATATNDLCAAYTTETASTTTWTMRTTFPEYVIALTTIVGSLLFSIFGGIGIACLPLSMIFSFLRRPRKIITRARYIKEATDLGKRAKELREITLALQREERTGGKGRKWRRNVKKVEQVAPFGWLPWELVYLEEDVQALEEVYPQGERAETSWALTVLGYLFKLLLGVFGFCVSAMWVAHIIVYMLVQPPAAPLLNQVFVKLDNAWGLLGTVAFAIFCMYLILAVIAGEMHLGMNLIFITIHPMKYGGTLMNSFLFNVGLILLCSISVIQFCAKAFSLYAQATAVQEIFGYTLESLRGLKYLFRYNVFQFVFILLSIGTLIYYLAYLRVYGLEPLQLWLAILSVVAIFPFNKNYKDPFKSLQCRF